MAMKPNLKKIFSQEFWWGKQPTKQQPIERQFVDAQASTSASLVHATGSKGSGGKTNFGLSRYIKQLVLDHFALRQNTRVAIHDSPQARTILRRQVDTTIGNGLKYDPTPSFELLGQTREQAEIWAEDVKEKFHLWAKSKKSDITGRNNFYQNMRFYAWQYGRDGEVYVRFHYSNNPDLINPLQISFVDPNQIRGDEFTFSLGPTVQNDGIIKDKNGKEIGYKVWITRPELANNQDAGNTVLQRNHPNQFGGYEAVEIPAVDKKTGLPLMIHGYDPEYTGQTRGMPEMSHALQDFEDMTSFDVSTVKKMTNSAGVVFTVKNDQADPSDLDLGTLTTDRAAGITVEGESTPSAAPTPIGAEAVVAHNLPEATLTEAGVNLLGGRQGDELKLVESASPAENSGEYMMSKFNILAASMSQSPEIVKMLFTNSHAASRAAMGFQAQVNKIKIDDIASDFLDIVIIAWFSGQIANGQIRAPGFSDPTLREAWLMHTWRGTPLPDVDPLKTRQAVNEAIKGGLTDLDTEAANYNNSNGKANRAKLARQVPELTTFPTVEPEPDPDTKEEDK